ncbi:hypothetical protein [Chryseobacterium indologenes]|uniref:hypothetical protein n=1 Tax=Chryseobacterium indologenes TaxID=253 RepID=UPI000AB00845|nr:hypothetical protein [Chryseobacterium indologenes]
MKEDFKSIKALIKKNEFFYKQGLLKRNEYSENCLLFAGKIDTILNANERIRLKNFLEDEFSFPKFMLSIEILKATPN